MLPEIQSKVVLIKAMRVRVFVLKPVWSFCFFECCFLFRLLLLLHFPSGASSPVVSSIKREDGDRQQRKVHERSSQPNGVKVGQRYGTRWREERVNLSLLYVHLFLRSPTPDPAVGPVPNATLFPLLNFLVFFFFALQTQSKHLTNFHLKRRRAVPDFALNRHYRTETWFGDRRWPLNAEFQRTQQRKSEPTTTPTLLLRFSFANENKRSSKLIWKTSTQEGEGANGTEKGSQKDI